MRFLGHAHAAIFVATAFYVLALGRSSAGAYEGQLFQSNLAPGQWHEFSAAGYPSPVAGVIYQSEDPPVCGVPMGGMATGCIDVEAGGVWGYSSLFNPSSEFQYNPSWRMPRVAPSLQPILGVFVNGKTHVLCDKKFISGATLIWETEPHFPGGWAPEAKTYSVNTSQLTGVEAARSIRYWGHYPVADYQFECSAPITISMRCWAPFLPGSTAASNIPAAVFEVHLFNPTKDPHSGTLALDFPGPEAVSTTAEYRQLGPKSGVTGVFVHCGESESANYVLAALDQPSVRWGTGLSRTPDAWAQIGRRLPQPKQLEKIGASDGEAPVSSDGSAAVAVNFDLAPGEHKVVRFVLAWHAPRWAGANRQIGGAQPKSEWKAADQFGDQLFYEQMYGARFANAVEVAEYVASNHGDLLNRIIAWQNVIYAETKLPPWLRDSLINNLHLVTESSYWAQGKAPLGDWAFPNGIFLLNESSRGCPHAANIPCDWYGNWPIAFFFPDLARTTLRGFKQYQHADGEVPFALGKIGGLPDACTPEFYWQKSLNGVCYVDLIDRLWQATGDDTIVDEFYDSAKAATNYTVGLSTRPNHVIRMPDDGGMEWFEHGEWAGMATHLGGLRLAQLAIMERMASHKADATYTQRCREWLTEGQKAMEKEMWTGSYYLNFWEPETGKKSDDVMAYQLDGEWAARFHGLAGVFRQDRVNTTLATIRRTNVPLTPDIGAANFARPDGTPVGSQKKDANDPSGAAEEVGHYGAYAMFTAEVPVLGMTYMMAGDREFGLELIRRHWHNLVCRQGLTWDMPNFVDGRTGERLFGTDYYQAMMLWAVPAVYEGHDVQAFCGRDGLVQRIIQAAQGSKQ